MHAANSKNIASFLKMHFVYQYSFPETVVINRKIEFKEKFKTICKAIKISRIIISAYNSKANRIIKEKYYIFASILVKTGKK